MRSAIRPWMIHLTTESPILSVNARSYAPLSGHNPPTFRVPSPATGLLSPLAARILGCHVLRLIKLWLKTPVEETDRRMTGGQRSCTCGTPQGGLISPLLANRYMNQSLRHWPAGYFSSCSAISPSTTLGCGCVTGVAEICANSSITRSMREPRLRSNGMARMPGS